MSSVVGSRTWVAPKERAKSLRAGAISETIILEAPFARRVWRTARPIGPPYCSRSVSAEVHRGMMGKEER